MNQAVPIVGVAEFFRFITGAARWRPGCILALAATLASGAGSLLHGQTFDTPPPEIVSAWKHNSEDTILVFRYDGSYYQVHGGTTRPGMERGTFTWDKATQAFTAETIVDTNGTSGLSHPAGATSISITGTLGESLNYTVVGEGTFSFTRIVNAGPAIIGSWIIPGEKFSITFLADNSYYLTEETNDIPFGYTGMEKGNYSWDPTSKAFTATATIDTNGDVGVNGITLATGVTIHITGNSLVFFDGVEATTLLRLTTNPTPLRLPDFGTVRFENYIQTSNNSPVLRQFDALNETAPYYAEAFVDPDTNATAPTVRIGLGNPIPMNLDVDNPGSFFIDEGFSDLNALNAFLPASTAIQFTNTTATANLTTGTTLTFPSIPKINVTNGGSWVGGIYLFGDNEVLRWTLPTGFDATKFITILEINDSFTGAEIASAELHGDVTHFDLTGKLNPDDEYEVELEFYRIDNSTTTGSGVFAGKQGYVLSSSSTFFKLRSRDIFPGIPIIAAQPVSQPGTANSPLLLTVGINEAAFPFSTFQWFKYGNPIPGQTGNSLFISNYSNAADGGTYNVVVSNAAGSDTSNLAALGPAIVKFVIVGKEIEYVQTGVSTVVVNPELPSEFYGGAYGFNASVEGQNMQLLTAPTVTPPAGTPNTAGDPFYSTLSLDEWDEPEWSYGPNANNWGDTSQSAIDTRFPNGTYTFSVGGVSVPLNLTGNAYPNTPQLTLTGGTWINGKYAMDAASPLTVTTNVFTGYGSNVDGHIGLWINDVGVEYFKSSSPATSSANYTLLANTLPTNQVTYIDAGFDAIVNKSAALAGAYCAAVYSKSVDMEVHILPKIISQSSSQVLPPNTSVNLQVSATGSPATGIGRLNYQWRKDGVMIPDEIFTNLFAFSSSANISGTYTCTVSNDVGTATTQPIHLEYADEFQAFAASYGLNSVTTGAPDADFDKDGIPNLLEYLFGGNPTLPNSGLLPAVTKAPGSNSLVFTYKRKTAAAGVTQVIEHATILSPPWTPAVHGAGGVTIATTPVPGDATAEQITVTIPSTSASRFVRLRASRSQTL